MKQQTDFGNQIKEQRGGSGSPRRNWPGEWPAPPSPSVRSKPTTYALQCRLLNALLWHWMCLLEERSDFIRAARSISPDTPHTPTSPTPPPSSEEIGAEDLSGRAIRGYELADRIGTGGFGVVYRAIQPLVETRSGHKDHPAEVSKRP